MKKKFIIFTLCFTLIFSSLNYKKSYADAGVISLPILATVSTLAVATGIALNDLDDIYDIGRVFYEKNKMIWNTVVATFNSCVSFNKATNKLSIDKPFIDIFKDTFSDYKDNNSNSQYVYSSLLSSLNYTNISQFDEYNPFTFVVNDNSKVLKVEIYHSSSSVYMNSYVDGIRKSSVLVAHSISDISNSYLIAEGYKLLVFGGNCVNIRQDLYKIFVNTLGFSDSIFDSVALPYSGVYDPSVLDDKDDIYMPGSLDSLLGGNVKPGDILGDKPFDGISDGTVSLPNSSNPSIEVDKDVSFPFVGDGVGDNVVPESPSVPNEGIFSTITNYIVGLIVPSNTFWTDTWGGLYNSFVSSFPMVDMDGFKELVTGEKKFPNIDITIMGSKGRVVNGDVVNSIVDWLRPIIAGFIMLCLMFFNYRKIYKLIRNSEPFEGIGKVENHAN